MAAEKGVPAPAIVQGEPVHHIAQVLFDTDTDPHGLYATVRIQPPLRGATETYLSNKGSGGILRPSVFADDVTEISAFAAKYDEETTEHRSDRILSAVAHLVCDLDDLSRGEGPWAQFSMPEQGIQVISTGVAEGQ